MQIHEIGSKGEVSISLSDVTNDLGHVDLDFLNRLLDLGIRVLLAE